MKKDNETESIQLRLELFDFESGHQRFTLEDLEEHDFIFSGFDDEASRMNVMPYYLSDKQLDTSKGIRTNEK